MKLAIYGIPGRLWRGMVDLAAPSLCLICAEPVGEPASLCLSCWDRLRQIDEPVCDALGTPFAYDQGEGSLSAAALADPPPWDRARAAVLFDETSGRLVHALKYLDRQEAGLLMARMMARAGRNLLAETDLIIPVPLHRFRLWRRRFNQSAFLARQVATASGRPCSTHLLLRRRPTRTQVGLEREERRKNVRNAFALTPEGVAAIAGKSVLLIDDVRTTGATAEACARVLKEAGAARVNLLSFALVPAPARPHI
jgi:ComF family protein